MACTRAPVFGNVRFFADLLGSAERDESDEGEERPNRRRAHSHLAKRTGSCGDLGQTWATGEPGKYGAAGTYAEGGATTTNFGMSSLDEFGGPESAGEVMHHGGAAEPDPPPPHPPPPSPTTERRACRAQAQGALIHPGRVVLSKSGGDGTSEGQHHGDGERESKGSTNSLAGMADGAWGKAKARRNEYERHGATLTTCLSIARS